MAKCRLAVFDADGTLFNSEQAVFSSIRHTIKELNLPEISEAQMRTHLGPPLEQSYARSFGIEGELLRKACEVHKAYNTEYGTLICPFYPGTEQMLDSLRSKGIKLAVASLKPAVTLDRLIEVRGYRFDSVHGYLQDGRSKADLIRMCMGDLSVPQEETVMVGDTESDRLGAEGAGVRFVPVSYGFGFGPSPDAASSPEEIPEYIERIFGN